MPDKFTVLETERFRLRKIEPEDIDVLFGYWSDAVVTEYLPHTFNSIQQVGEMVEMLNGLVEKGEGARWAIVSKSNDEVVGTCGYHNVRREYRRAEIGYELGRDHWGKGIIQEAVSLVIEHCFKVLDFHRLEAFVTDGNTRSVRSLEKLGFQVEGLLRDYEYYKGRYQDQLILSYIKKS